MGEENVKLKVPLGHKPNRRMPLLSARPAVTFPSSERHRPWPVPILLLVERRRHCVNSLPRVGASNSVENCDDSYYKICISHHSALHASGSQ